METETEVVTSEIVQTDERDTSSAKNAVVLGLAVIGGVKVARFAAARVPFRIVRKSKVVAALPVPTPETPVVTE